MVSVRPLTLMSPDDGRVTDTGGLSCDLLLDFVTERFYVVVVVGGWVTLSALKLTTEGSGRTL